MNDTVKQEISNIIRDFVSTNDGDKQCFNIFETDGYKRLEEAGCDGVDDVVYLREIITSLVNSYTELCDRFGDYNW